MYHRRLKRVVPLVGNFSHQRVKPGNSFPLPIQVLKLGSRASSPFVTYLTNTRATGIRKETRERGSLVGRHARLPRFLAHSS